MLPGTQKDLSDDQQGEDKDDYLKWFPINILIISTTSSSIVIILICQKALKEHLFQILIG